MTEQIKSALRTLNKWKNCICTVDADDCICRICADCEFNYDNDNIEESVDTAICSLQAWSEVLQELEKKNALYMSYLNNKENPYDSELFGKHIAVENCIDIINQKLKQIEEGE